MPKRRRNGVLRLDVRQRPMERHAHEHGTTHVRVQEAADNRLTGQSA